MSQGTLFDLGVEIRGGVPFVAGSATSRAGAAAVEKNGRRTPIRELVLAFVREATADPARRGATDDEIFQGLRRRGLIPQTTRDSTVRARRVELCDQRYIATPLVRRSGRERATAGGGMGDVWEAIGGVR